MASYYLPHPPCSPLQGPATAAPTQGRASPGRPLPADGHTQLLHGSEGERAGRAPRTRPFSKLRGSVRQPLPCKEGVSEGGRRPGLHAPRPGSMTPGSQVPPGEHAPSSHREARTAGEGRLHDVAAGLRSRGLWAKAGRVSGALACRASRRGTRTCRGPEAGGRRCVRGEGRR